MKFDIKLPAIAGETIPLFAIAHAMAERDATAGGTEFHEPTYKGRLARYEDMLLRHVRDGRLSTCDTDGDLEKPATIVQRRLARVGVQVLRDVASRTVKKGRKGALVGSTDVTPDGLAVDEDQTWLIHLFVSLKVLNEWALGMGHEFAVTHDGVSWFDERGLVTPGATLPGPAISVPAVLAEQVPAGMTTPAGAGSQTWSGRSPDETPVVRDDRRYRELLAAGGGYVFNDNKWRATGPRGLLAKLWKQEKAAGCPMSDEKDVRESLKKAAKRARAARDAGLKGNSAFNR